MNIDQEDRSVMNFFLENNINNNKLQRKINGFSLFLTA